MNDIDKILVVEKQQEHKLDNPDLLTFATLTQIAHENATRVIKKRFLYSTGICLVAVLLCFEVIAAGQLSFTEFTHQLHGLLVENPFVFTILNGGIVIGILAMRRLRFF